MGRNRPNPTIRILMLGSAGVGKKCLESMFATKSYPPIYDPSMTLSSRRLFTLSPRPHTPTEASTRPLATSHGLESAFGEQVGYSQLDETSRRAHQRQFSTSSTVSNPASIGPPVDPGLQHAAAGPRSEDGSRCASYLVELTNVPSRHWPTSRSHAHGKPEYDAVLLVYDVSSRASFDAITDLHAEIPLQKRHRRRSSQSAAGSNTGRTTSRAGNSQLLGTGETVVALVGNKKDLDDGYLGAGAHADGSWLEKEAVLQEEDIEERSLTHPLFRDSCLRDGGALSPRSVHSTGGLFFGLRSDELRPDDARRSFMSADHVLLQQRHSTATQRSVRTVQVGEEKLLPRLPRKTDQSIEKWIDTGSPTVEDMPEETSVSAADMANVDTGDTQSTVAPKREVSWGEGEMLAKNLLLPVPFFETSARTGENVDELIEAVVKEVLREMGRPVIADPQPEPALLAPPSPVKRKDRARGRLFKARSLAVIPKITQSRSEEAERSPESLSPDVPSLTEAETTGSSLTGQKTNEDIKSELDNGSRARGIRKRPSIIGRLMSVWTHKSSVTATSVGA